MVHLKVVVRAVAEKFLATWPEVGKTGKELLGCHGGRLMEMDRGHGAFLDTWMIPPVPEAGVVTYPEHHARKRRGRGLIEANTLNPVASMLGVGSLNCASQRRRC
ncbi:hypothetical protein [Rhodococcus sp. ACT016]|uniref:hypothetical protein n=1 Tax=Rhodococcus sp. ACT016 TaxID=3134808 RepID=UPI003D264EE0